jgi:hypothetical protein
MNVMMEFVSGRCTNDLFCAVASSGEEVRTPAGANFVCPQCGKPLTRFEKPPPRSGLMIGLIAGGGLAVTGAGLFLVGAVLGGNPAPAPLPKVVSQGAPQPAAVIAPVPPASAAAPAATPASPAAPATAAVSTATEPPSTVATAVAPVAPVAVHTAAPKPAEVPPPPPAIQEPTVITVLPTLAEEAEKRAVVRVLKPVAPSMLRPPEPIAPPRVDTARADAPPAEPTHVVSASDATAQAAENAEQARLTLANQIRRQQEDQARQAEQLRRDEVREEQERLERAEQARLAQDGRAPAVNTSAPRPAPAAPAVAQAPTRAAPEPQAQPAPAPQPAPVQLAMIQPPAPAATSAPPATPAPAAAAPAKQGGITTAFVARPVSGGAPTYPVAYEDRTGHVTVRCHIGTNGFPSGCRLVSVRGGNEFGNAVLDWLDSGRVRFAPILHNGVAVAETHEWTLNFQP